MSRKAKSRAQPKATRSLNPRAWPWPAVLGIAVIVGVAGLIIYAAVEAAKPPQALQPIDGVESFPNVARGHVERPVTYDQTPPAGGEHNPVWQNCGVYTQPIANENAVHSLEHGAVWITYQPDLPAEQIQALQALGRGSGFRLVSPYPDLPGRVVISAWGYQLKVDSADDPRLSQFIEKYEQSPNGPEPGAPCTGGIGQPG